MARGWHKVQIADFPAHRAYMDPDERWNGWACPWFTFEEAVLMNAWLPEIDGEVLRYDSKEDAFSCMEDGEETEAFRGEEVDGMHLYPIGRGIWIWSLEDE